MYEIKESGVLSPLAFSVKFKCHGIYQGPTDTGLLGPMPMLILGSNKILISKISDDILYILNVVIKHLWQRYVMKEGYLTNFILNISGLITN